MTILDVAAMAGVSVGTVSNVLNGTITVSEARRQRVLDVIKELGYSPNMLALGLRRKRSPVVGICVPQTSIPYFSALMEAFEEVAAAHGIEIMQVLSQGDAQIEYQRIVSLLKYRVGGLLIVPSKDPSATYEMIAASGVPTVVVERAPDDDFAFDRVTFDNHAVMQRATQGLIDRGHRSILFIVSEAGLIVNQQRIAGMRAAADPVGVHIRVLEGGRDQSTLTARLAGELQNEPRPTAIVVSTSTFAAWVLRAFRVLRIDCPRDISLLSFEQPEWEDLVTPKLSVVSRPTREIARMAWTFLMRRMRNEAEIPQRIQLDAEVIFRESVRHI
ncbi:LacI family DNA-binding transcriptional regulator [Bosea sp. BK604]|uniref:LacI family DNA-binding transcriptional regulator n=1 Tax=Bosea sp. BK604 TaxID=2512180 RepID=UPI001404C680|nr:LacI family DNA-binding transcriptional regulator [Bosea sp. BK604]